MKKALFFLLAGILLTGCSGERVSHIYAFGDDHSDKGQCSEGRMSNGPLAIEVVAERLNVDLTDYAWCLALSGYDYLDEVDPLDDTTLLGQVDKFQAELNGKKADPEALYFIEIGMLDFFMTEVSGSADLVVANIGTAVTRLAELGAKHFMVGNSFNLSKFPGFLGNATQAEMFQTKMNAALPGEMDKLAQEKDLEIEIFDISAAEERIRNNPEQYGFTQLEIPCTRWGLEFYPSEICENPDEYYYWGYYYLSGAVHKAIGEAMAEQVSK